MPKGGARLGAGRKPKPGNQKKTTGSKGKGGREPQFAVGIPDRPAMLDGDAIACAEWDRKAALLLEQRVLTVADGSVLARYCALYSRLQRIRAQTKTPGFAFVVETDLGPKKNPMVTVETETLRELRMVEQELGLTPHSRTRVASIAPEPQKDPAAELLDALTGGKPALMVVRGGKSRR